MTYDEKAMEKILDCVEVFIPMTTNLIAKRARKNYNEKISHSTVERLLEELKKKGEVRCYKSGKTLLWQR